MAFKDFIERLIEADIEDLKDLVNQSEKTKILVFKLMAQYAMDQRKKAEDECRYTKGKAQSALVCLKNGNYKTASAHLRAVVSDPYE